MIKTKISIINKLGLHARAAAKWVSVASNYGCDVQLGRSEELVDGKSIMAVMMLAAAKGTTLDLIIDGADETDAHHALINLVANRFEEQE